MGMDIMARILLPFVQEKLSVGLGKNWEDLVLPKFKEKRLKCIRWDKKNKIEWIDWDLLASLHAINEFWEEIFENALKKMSNERVNKLKESRNKTAHNKPVSPEEARDALDIMIDLAEEIGANKDDINELEDFRPILNHVKEGKPLYITTSPDETKFVNKQGWEEFIKDIQLQEKECDIRYILGKYDEAIENYARIIDELEAYTEKDSTQQIEIDRLQG